MCFFKMQAKWPGCSAINLFKKDSNLLNPPSCWDRLNHLICSYSPEKWVTVTVLLFKFCCSACPGSLSSCVFFYNYHLQMSRKRNACAHTHRHDRLCLFKMCLCRTARLCVAALSRSSCPNNMSKWLKSFITGNQIYKKGSIKTLNNIVWVLSSYLWEPVSALITWQWYKIRDKT